MLSDRLPPLDLGLQTEQLIRSFPMFAGLDETELKAVVRVLRPRLLVPDEMIIRKGERGRSMFFISSGAVEVVLPGQRIRLGSGDFFGEMALLSQRTADRRCRLARLRKGARTGPGRFPPLSAQLPARPRRDRSDRRGAHPRQRAADRIVALYARRAGSRDNGFIVHGWVAVFPAPMGSMPRATHDLPRKTVSKTA